MATEAHILPTCLRLRTYKVVIDSWGPDYVLLRGLSLKTSPHGHASLQIATVVTLYPLVEGGDWSLILPFTPHERLRM